MEDLYKILGVDRGADDGALRSSFRQLAKQHHPDLNPGNDAAEAKFKEVNAAYELLSDPEKRARYDRGEIDGSGAERAPERPTYQDFGDQTARGKYRAAGSGFAADDLDDILRAFGGRARAAGAGPGGWDPFPRQGADARYAISVDFLDAANGVKRRITMPDSRSLDLTIPAGVESGKVLRLRGQGGPGADGGDAGDALIEVTVEAHPFFRRDGNDVVVTLPVTIKEAVLGAKVTVPTIKGSVALNIPANSSTGARLRLKGRGIRGGHQFVEIEIVIPPTPEPELAAFLENWEPKSSFAPRRHLGETDA